MFLSNITVVLRMLTDSKYRRFSRLLHGMCKRDPGYSFAGRMGLLIGSIRGEKVVKFGEVYVTSSYIPPVPSRAFFSFLGSSRDKDRPFSDIAWVRRSAPLSTYISVTDRCPYDCRHCSAKFRRKGSELSTSQWIKVIGDLQDLGTAYIGFTGGEPLMRDDMEEIIRCVDDRSTTILFTNGKGLRPSRAHSLKQSGLFALSVSLDSADPLTHNRLRGDDEAFSTALGAIGNASQAGLYTIVQAVVFKRELSKQKLFALFKLVKRHGAHEVRIHQPVPSGRLLEAAHNGDIFYSEEDRKQLFKIQFAANRKPTGFPKVSSFPYTEGPEKFGCSAGLLHSYITASGELCPCDFVPLSFGNVLKFDIKELYKRMNQASGIPKMSCCSFQLVPHLRGKTLPLSPLQSVRICRRLQSANYPGFYKQLQQVLP